MKHRTNIPKAMAFAFYYLVVLTGIYLIERHSYLLFHTIVELFSVCVAFTIFMIVWNCRQIIQNNYILFLGVTYLFVGGFDLVHTLAYEGMGVFATRGGNLATQLWLVARYFESISFLLAPLFLKRRVRCGAILAVGGGLTALALLCIFVWRVFPLCFTEQAGLTAFKEISEFIIIGILFAALTTLLQRKSWFDPKVLTWVSVSIVVTIVSEFMFTLYAAPYDRASIVGHFLKLISFYLMYKALVETGLRQPHTLLYRRLKQHESDLQQAHDDLELRVKERTAELSRVVERLQGEIEARIRAEEEINAHQQQLRALAVQLLKVEDQERHCIASELHDSVGQILAFLKIELGELQRAGLPPESTEAIGRIRAQVDEAIKLTRSLTFEISPPELYTLGLESALEELAQRFSQERRIACHVSDSDDPKPLNGPVKTLLYRTVRELLINVAKHARAKQIHIRMSRIDERIQIVVEDDGCGFDVSRLDRRSSQKDAGFGLFSIRERLRHLDGTLEMLSGPEGGTRATVTAPLAPHETTDRSGTK